MASTKKIDIIYSVLEHIREINDDSDFSEEFVADQIDTVRNNFVKQTLRYSGDVTEDFIQSLDEVPVDLADSSASPIHSTNLSILISEDIPAPLRVKQKEYFTRIGSLNILEPSYNIIAYDSLPYVGNGKFNSKIISACYYKNFIILAANKSMLSFLGTEYINVRGVFGSPDEVETYNSISNIHHDWDYVYPIPDGMVHDLIKEVINTLSVKLQIAEDKINNSTNDK